MVNSGFVTTNISQVAPDTPAPYTLDPAPSNTPGDPTDGSITVSSTDDLVFTNQPTTTTAGQTIAGPTGVQVSIENAIGQVVTGDNSTMVTIALSSGTLNGTLTEEAVGGVVTFPNLSINTAATGYTLMASAPGDNGNTSNTFDITAAAGSQLMFTTTAQTLTAGVVSDTITVEELDSFGNVSDTAETVNLSTSNTSTGLFKDNATGLTTITSVSIPSGSSTASFKYVDTLASNPTLTASATGLTPATQTETVIAAAASQLVYTTTPQTLTAGVLSGTLTVQEEDAFGNVTTTAETVNLSTSNTSTGLFKDNATGLTTITSVSIPAGSSTASFKYVDTLASTPTLTASATGLTSAMQTETVIAAAASKLLYTTTPQTLTAGVLSGTLTVQEEDAFGNVSTTAETVNLSTSNTSTGLFEDNATGTTMITSVSIPAGSSTASFKYVDTLMSTPTLTAAATGLTSAMQTETVIAATASQLVFITPPQTLLVGVLSGTLTVEEEDAFGNVSTTAETVNLSTTNTATGLFKDNATGLTTITSVSIPAGSSTASFKYVDTLMSTPTLTAAATGLTPAMQTETVTANHLVFTNQPTTTAAGQTIAGPTGVQVSIENTSNQVVTTDNGTMITIALSTGTLNGTLTEQDVNGVATFANLSINTAATGDTLTATAPSDSGSTSNAFNITAAAVSKLVYTTTAQTLTAGVVSGTITVQELDAFGNVSTTAETVNLSTTNTNTGLFKDNATGQTTITSVTIPAGSSTASFKYVDTLASSPTLTASATGLTSATQTETVIAAAASKLVYTTPAQTLTAGVVSDTLTVQEEDAFGNVTTTAETVNLSTSNTATGLFKDDATGTRTITSVSIPSGSSTASFKYVDTLASTPTLVAAATGLTSAMQTETVIAAAASQLIYTTTAQTLTAGVNSGTITVEEKDAFGNVSTTAETVNLSMSNPSPPGLFKDNATGQTTITSVSIPFGSSTASFKYVDTLVSSPTLVAAATGLTSAMQTETVIAAAASKLVFGQQPTTTVAGLADSPAITVQLEDQFGNVVRTNNTASLTLTVATGPGVVASGGTATVANGDGTFAALKLDTAAPTRSRSATLRHRR